MKDDDDDDDDDQKDRDNDDDDDGRRMVPRCWAPRSSPLTLIGHTAATWDYTYQKDFYYIYFFFFTFRYT